jgi:Rho-binding antiterminator
MPTSPRRNLYGPSLPALALSLPSAAFRVGAGHLGLEAQQLNQAASKNPGHAMTTEQSHYRPINCEFHDLLEDLATLRRSARIGFLDESGLAQHRDAVITDVFARDGAEYVSLGTGEILRLDRLVEVDGARLADYGESSTCAL